MNNLFLERNFIVNMIKHIFRGRMLASFQDHEHEGGDTRSQDGINDNDIKIKIQDHSMQKKFPRTRLQVSRKVPRYHIGDVEAQTWFEATSKKFNKPPLSRVNTLGSEEDSIKHQELMEFCTYCLNRHKEMYIISSHTKKIFANMRRIEAGFSGKKQQPRRTQRKEAEISHDESEDEDHVPTPSSDPLPSGEDSSILNELMVFCTGLQEQVFDLQEAKDAQAKKIAALKKKVTKLTKWRKSRSGGLKRLKKIGSVMDSAAEPVTTVKDSAAPTTDVTKDEITMAQALAALKSVKPKVVVQEQEMSTTIPAAATEVTTTVPTPRAKGKAKMIQPEVPLKKKDQMMIDEEYARKLQAEEQEAARLTKEREEFPKVQKARLLVELIEKRKKHFVALRTQEKRNKPPTKTQMKSQMSTYMRHMGGYKQSHLKGRSFDEIKELFDREMRKVNDFVAINLKAQKSSAKEAQENSTKRTIKHLESDISKKQKVNKNVEPVIDDIKELKKYMEIVLDDGDEVLIEATPISSISSTIIDYKIHKDEKKNYFKIIRADGNSQVY
nr:hypothetical protein [Tanacetum cinerariifolium]